MGGIKSKGPKKYVLLYGPKDAGKSLALYFTQARFDNSIIKEKIWPTVGVNYEEVELGANIDLGIFDVSGDIMQYDLVNIICKSVEISGIIFVVPGEKIDMFDTYKEQLKLILNNKYLDNGTIYLMILYNLKSDDSEKLKWIETQTFDAKLKPKHIAKMLPEKNIISRIVDVNYSMQNQNSFREALKDFCEKFEINYQ